MSDEEWMTVISVLGAALTMLVILLTALIVLPLLKRINLDKLIQR